MTIVHTGVAFSPLPRRLQAEAEFVKPTRKPCNPCYGIRT